MSRRYHRRPGARPSVRRVKDPQSGHRFPWKLAAVCGTVIVLALLAAWRLYQRPFETFERKWIEAKFARVYPKASELTGLSPDQLKERLFPQQVINRLYDGAGYRVTFETTYSGGAPVVQSCEIPPWEGYERSKEGRQNNPERRKAVQQGEQSLIACAQRFTENKPLVTRIALVVDITGGLTSSLQVQVRQRFEDLGLARMISRGDRIALYGFLLQDASYIDERHVINQTTVDWYDTVVNWLLTPRSAQAESSVATGLFNILTTSQELTIPETGDAVLLPWQYHIFSDGLENSPRTVSLYRRPELLEQARWPELTKLVGAVRPVPTLPKGTSVAWYLPKQKQAEDLLLKSGKFWEWLLGQAGATVKVHY